MTSENINATYAWLKAEGFMLPALKIDRDDLIAALMAERLYLNDAEIDDTDVRLVVYSHNVGGTVWDVQSGDVCYDTVHGIMCGSSMVGRYDTHDAIRETADDLISQVEDQYADALATFKIKHSHGQTETGIDTYEDAVSKVREVYGDDVEIGHSGDINDFGNRTLCWQSDVPEADRDGSRACCSIVKVYEAIDRARENRGEDISDDE